MGYLKQEEVFLWQNKQTVRYLYSVKPNYLFSEQNVYKSILTCRNKQPR